MTRHLVEGFHLNVEEFGPSPSVLPPLVMLHGFTGSSESWRGVGEALAGVRRPIGVDLLGHGGSDKPRDPAMYRAERQVAQLLALFDRLDLSAVDLLGYSMGGRVALRVACAAPVRLRSLILESASPGIVDPSERAARVESDEGLADFAEQAGIEPFVERWEAVPLFASQARLPGAVRDRHRAQRLANDPAGLAASLRGFGAGVPEPLWEPLRSLRLPTLLVAGALDAKYCALGRAVAAAIPGARLEVIANAGHAVHLEQPDAYARLVGDFLSS